MSGPSIPSYIFTCRHGHRLDTADSTWQYSSPTPYDTPLTYGGWLQGRSLGMRIANVLYSRPPPSPGSKRKQTRIIIHTSPFLRCIQTSIAIAAGLAQFDHQHNLTTCSINANDPSKSAFGTARREEYIKPLLRIDCWLGEWLTPDYYTEISPPPESAVLAAFAKNDLMRPPSAGAIRSTMSGSSSPQSNGSSSPLNTVGELGTALPGYIPPKPAWAVSSNAPIPRGYVSHAKDYIEIDFGWDSLKFGNGGEYGEDWTSMHKRFRKGYGNALMWYAANSAELTTSKSTWGKSGSSKRTSFTNASVDSSTSSGASTTVVSDEHLGGVNSETEAEEPEIETVVIFATHGAGCNALIGAMTDKPVLIDISIASLTMAVKQEKPPPKPSLNTSFSSGILPPPRPPSLHDMPFSYDVKIVASTEHLRKGSMAAVMGGSQSASPSLAAFRSQFTGSSIALPESGIGSREGSLAAQGTPSFVIRSGLDGINSRINISSIISSGGADSSSPGTAIGRAASESTNSVPGPQGIRRSATMSSGPGGLWSRPAALMSVDGGPPASETSSPRSSTGSISGMFRDREREQRHRGSSKRREGIAAWNADESAIGSGSEESDASENGRKVKPGLWTERKRRWTVDKAGVRR